MKHNKIFYINSRPAIPFGKISTWVCHLAFLLLLASCKKLISVDTPVTQLTSQSVYSNNATAAAVLTGIYTQMATPSPQNQAASITSISLSSGLYADELTLFGGASNANSDLAQYYFDALTPGDPTSTQGSLWNDLYFKIYSVNLALENLPGSTGVTPAVRQQLSGEAKFLRAFFNFYLINLYGDVPLTTSSNYLITSGLSRSPIAQVYRQIVADLNDASTLLTPNYVASDAVTQTTDRIRPNKWTALALLARAYLFTGKYDSAQIAASAVINNTALYDTVSLNSVFLKNSKEAIWQLQPVNAGWNTEDARVFILPPTGPTSNNTTQGFPVYMSQSLLKSFAPGDQRRSAWLDSVIVNADTFYYPYKYKSATFNTPVTEYTMVFRLSEQYLIRSEAKAHLGNITGSGSAVADLNIIRTRAGLPDYNGPADQTGVLAAIQKERQSELFTEWGHRWLDLKRTNTADAVMSAVATLKPASWNSSRQLYPVPAYDITQDPNLNQNGGY